MTFSAQTYRCERFASAFVQAAPGARRILDIGCGTGEQIAALAQRIPTAEFFGVDIDVSSVAIAKYRQGRFIAGDYMTLIIEPVDAIVSYSTLQLIDVSSEALFSKIWRDLKPGGLALIAMPYECAYNAAIIGVRRLLRAMRSQVTDAAILAVAGAVHGMDRRMIEERLPYMYETPKRLYGLALRSVIEKCGLAVVDERPEVHASVAQLKHKIVLIRRSSP